MNFDNFRVETTIFHLGCIDNISIENLPSYNSDNVLNFDIENLSNFSIENLTNDIHNLLGTENEIINGIINETIVRNITDFLHLMETDGTIMASFQDIIIGENEKKEENKKNLNELLGSYTRTNKNHLNQECSICTDKFKEKEGLRILKCNHYFHKKCIDKWLIKGSETCPICRRNPFDNKN